MKLQPNEIETLNRSSSNKETHKITIAKYDMEKYDFTEKELNAKKIKKLETVIRSSFEYSKWTRYFREELDLNTCKLIPNLDIKKTSIKIEYHHAPMTLYDITETLARYLLAKAKGNGKETVSDMEVYELVVKTHYDGIVGMVPLTKTHHKMVHADGIIVPASFFNGDYDEFVKLYWDFMSDDFKHRYNRALNMSDEDNANFINAFKLQESLIYLDVTYEDTISVDKFFD